MNPKYLVALVAAPLVACGTAYDVQLAPDRPGAATGNAGTVPPTSSSRAQPYPAGRGHFHPQSSASNLQGPVGAGEATDWSPSPGSASRF
ncbi:hypothetical protein [Caldimonas brevitalea]|uniref:Lipoprotein n=1 Tax=Caldimonas brevitalea TaxID=413882 RepID=A0A0G3BMX7_9BURK|nr:hypothetical protein [Caldimonas brevitalea]AKJ27890.1 hypothetical protein AAW51_1199 [Caldimonas brevitalea]